MCLEWSQPESMLSWEDSRLFGGDLTFAWKPGKGRGKMAPGYSILNTSWQATTELTTLSYPGCSWASAVG